MIPALILENYKETEEKVSVRTSDGHSRFGTINQVNTEDPMSPYIVMGLHSGSFQTDVVAMGAIVSVAH